MSNSLASSKVDHSSLELTAMSIERESDRPRPCFDLHRAGVEVRRAEVYVLNVEIRGCDQRALAELMRMIRDRCTP